MVGDRARYGLLTSTLGAIVLAVSVFLPWYGVSFTAAGLTFAQQVGDQAASQFGNAALQGYMSSFHANLSSLAIAIALMALAGPGSSAGGHRAPLALIGAVAAMCVLYRMIDPPAVAGNLLALSLREGAWLALLGSLAMTGGALWPRRGALARPADTSVQGVWAELSGWTPES
jgi:hypothetical protein